jgi:hypothetical protein
MSASHIFTPCSPHWMSVKGSRILSTHQWSVKGSWNRLHDMKESERRFESGLGQDRLVHAKRGKRIN